MGGDIYEINGKHIESAKKPQRAMKKDGTPHKIRCPECGEKTDVRHYSETLKAWVCGKCWVAHNRGML